MSFLQVYVTQSTYSRRLLLCFYCVSFLNLGGYFHVHKNPILTSVLRTMGPMYSFFIKSVMKFIIYHLFLVLQMFSFLMDNLFQKKFQFGIENKDEIMFVIRRRETY
jgi:hypothetical protein